MRGIRRCTGASLFWHSLSSSPLFRDLRARMASSSAFEAILSKMTLEQKIDHDRRLRTIFIFARIRNSAASPAHGRWPARRPQRRNRPPPMAGGISLAASWDPALAEQEGIQIGRDARAKGVHFMLGPAFNIYRAPMNGRNFEYMGEDPYLAGKIAVGYIQGMQSQGVSATAQAFRRQLIPNSIATIPIPSLTNAPCVKSISRPLRPQ